VRGSSLRALTLTLSLSLTQSLSLTLTLTLTPPLTLTLTLTPKPNPTPTQVLEYMIRDRDVVESAGTHVVSMIKGTVREIWRRYEGDVWGDVGEK